MSERGFLVCADITGYTQYLDESELDHASRILTDVLDLLLDEVQAPLRLSRVEGDAVISYVLASDGVSPQVLVDRLENTYVVFRRALDQIVVNSMCDCRACANLSWLDLKFIVHHGAFVVNQLRNQDELVGPDVNAMFRLAKNTIREALGTPGYIALTEAAADALTLPKYLAGFVEHEEPTASGDTARLFVKDMAPLWAQRRSQGTIDFAAEDIIVTGERAFPARLSTVWDYLTSPAMRNLMFASDREEVEALDDGRMGIDAVYVCWHGEHRQEHRIVDWDPPVRYAFVFSMGEVGTSLGEFMSRPDFERTVVTFRATAPIDADGNLIPLEARAAVAAQLTEFLEDAFDRTLAQMEADLASTAH